MPAGTGYSRPQAWAPQAKPPPTCDRPDILRYLESELTAGT